MELIRCPQCAKEIPDVSRFCRRCGSAVAWGAMLSTGTSTAAPWAGLPRSAWDTHRPPKVPPIRRAREIAISRRRGRRAEGQARRRERLGRIRDDRGGDVHVRLARPPRDDRADDLAAAMPAERIRTSPVRSAPPPQFYYPRPAGGSSLVVVIDARSAFCRRAANPRTGTRTRQGMGRSVSVARRAGRQGTWSGGLRGD